MEFQNVIETRRSMRKYDSSKKVDEATVTAMIEAAILAPSWKIRSPPGTIALNQSRC